MSNQSLHVFRVGQRAVVLQEISHWWVAEHAASGPELVVVMRNGKQMNFGKDDAPSGDDGHGIELGLVEFITRAGQR